MTRPESVSAFAIRTATGELTVDAFGMLWLIPKREMVKLPAGAALVPVLIVDDSPASRAVREAEQRVIAGALEGVRCYADIEALLAARAELEKQHGNG